MAEQLFPLLVCYDHLLVLLILWHIVPYADFYVFVSTDFHIYSEEV